MIDWFKKIGNIKETSSNIQPLMQTLAMMSWTLL